MKFECQPVKHDDPNVSKLEIGHKHEKLAYDVHMVQQCDNFARVA